MLILIFEGCDKGVEEQEDKLHLQRDAKILLVIASLFTIAIGLSNTFVNVYIWRLKQDFVLIGVYNLFIHTLLPLTFVVAGYYSKSRNGTITLRIGVIFHALFFLFILLLQEQAANYLVPLGSFLGIAGGFYWLSFEILVFDLTNDKNRDTFNSYNGMVSSISGMLAPLTAGFIISSMNELTGYYLVFGISLAIFVVIIGISTVLKTHKFEGEFKLNYILKHAETGWKALITGNFFFGIRNGVLIFLINLLVFIVAQNEFSIGKIKLIGAVISTIAFEFIEKVMNPEKRKLFITIGTMMMFIATGSIILKISFINILIFVIINAFFVPFFRVPFDSATYNLIDENENQKNRIEYIIFNELALNLGRIVGIIVFIIVASATKKVSNLKLILLIIGSSQLVVPFLFKKINSEVEVL